MTKDMFLIYGIIIFKGKVYLRRVEEMISQIKTAITEYVTIIDYGSL